MSRTTTRQLFAAVICAIVAIGGIAAAHTASASAPEAEGAAARLAAKINAERNNRDLTMLGLDRGLSDFAQEWAEHLAATGELAHRDELGAAAWAAGLRFSHIGENVGEGATIDELHDAFMASPTHRANIVAGDWTRVGVGVADGADGRMWVVVNFSDPA